MHAGEAERVACGLHVFPKAGTGAPREGRKRTMGGETLIGVKEYFRPSRLGATTSVLDEPGFEIRRAGDGLCNLQLWGRLRPSWSGSLAEGLADAGLSLVSGFARKIGPMRWLAEFELDCKEAGQDPLALDYLELVARTQASAGRTPIALHSYTVASSEKHGGSLYLEIGGSDRVGFLGSLLTGFAFLSLFPEEMKIATQAGAVHDRFFLTGTGRTVPPAQARQGLERWLRSLVRQ